jgi:N-acetylated-alpha-linked acidic dipeptidase
VDSRSVQEWGWDAEIETFSVLFPTPKERVLELVSPTHYSAKLDEPALAVDPTTGQKSEQLPTYNAYSIDGDVTGAARLRQLRPARGLRRPRALRHLGERRHRPSRGTANRGAGSNRKSPPSTAPSASLIYSDPKDDGFGAGEVFPKGPMRPPGGAQRGSVMDMPVYRATPLTPGVGSDRRREASCDHGRVDAHQNTRDADFV